VHDLHATMLHALGMNHEKLTYRYSGRDFRLTDVEGHVVYDILAYRLPRESTRADSRGPIFP
jgi:hypothetical protein